MLLSDCVNQGADSTPRLVVDPEHAAVRVRPQPCFGRNDDELKMVGSCFYLEQTQDHMERGKSDGYRLQDWK